MPIRKHKGINQQTGRLKKGYKYSGKKLKSGLPQIVKVKAQKGGNTRFPKNSPKQSRFPQRSPKLQRSQSSERFGRVSYERPCFDYQPACKGTDVDIWNESCNRKSQLRYNKKVERVAKRCADGRIKHKRCRLQRGMKVDEGHDGAIEKMLKKANTCRDIVDDQIMWVNTNAPKIYRVKRVRSAPSRLRNSRKKKGSSSDLNWRRG